MALAAALSGVLASPTLAQDCIGCTPLVDVAGPPYLGIYPLGLYPGVSNEMPLAHRALALQAAAEVIPRGSTGMPDPNGFIGVIAIGMSNANQEFAVFERQEDLNSTRNGRVVIVDCAYGSQTADIIDDPTVVYWNIVDQRITAAGLHPDQIQVVWFKTVEGVLPSFDFPEHADTLEAHVRIIVRHLKDRFPRLQLCYFSSRTYGGYILEYPAALHEPITYQSGFAFRNVIAAQIAGDPALNARPWAGPIEAPVLLWGPYLWANGMVPRASDGLTWSIADFESDGVHPSPSGEQKVANMLSGFFNSDATVVPWYLDNNGTELLVVEPEADAYVDDAQPAVNFGALPELRWAYDTVRSYVRFNLSAVTDSVVHAKLSLQIAPEYAINATQVIVVSNTTWNELTMTSANAPPFDGAMLGGFPNASRGTAVSLDVTNLVESALALPHGTEKVSIGFRAIAGSSQAQIAGSRESSDPPRLVLTTVSIPTAVGRTPAANRVLRLRVTPNPSSGVTRITVEARRPQNIDVAVYDIHGALVRRVFGGSISAGFRELVWDGKDARGQPIPSGVYFVRADDARKNGTLATEKAVILR